MIAVFLFMAIASPVSAAEIDTDTWFPVLDYTTVDNSGYVFITVNKSETVSFDLFGIRACYSFDILCNITGDRTDLGAQVTVNGRTFDLKVLHIGDYLYRLYGNVAGGLADTKVDLTITSAATTYVTFYQFDVLSVKHSSFPEMGQFAVNDYSGSTGFIQMSDSETPVYHRFRVNGSGEIYPYSFYGYFYPYNWKKYEYIDMFFTISALSIDSISVYSGDIGLPFELSYFDLSSGSWYTSGYHENTFETDGSVISSSGEYDFDSNERTVSFYCRIYVKDLDPDTATTPCVKITGEYNAHKATESAYIQLDSVTGHVQTDDINPLHYYFQDLYRKLGNWFGKVIDALDGDTAPGNEFQDELAPEIDQIQQDQAILDSVPRPNMGTLELPDYSMITGGTPLITLVLGTVMQSPGIGMIMSIGMGACMVSYLIFGKRG